MAIDQAERSVVKIAVDAIIKLLRCNIQTKSTTFSQPSDVPITREFIRDLLRALMHCCQINMTDQRFEECLTEVSGSTDGNENATLFGNDDELSNSVARVKAFRDPIYDAIRQGNMMMLVGGI